MKVNVEQSNIKPIYIDAKWDVKFDFYSEYKIMQLFILGEA